MRYLYFLFIIILAFSLTGCSMIEMGSTELAFEYSSFDELAKVTPLVVTGKVSGESEEFEYKGVTFVKTQIKIKDFYRNNYGLDKGEEITILQTYTEQDPIINKNDELLFFLDEYEGPIISEAYIINGAMYGQFKIKNNKIYSKAEKNTLMYKNYSTGATFDDLIIALNKTPYELYSKEKKTQEEIEREIMEEEKLIQEK